MKNTSISAVSYYLRVTFLFFIVSGCIASFETATDNTFHTIRPMCLCECGAIISDLNLGLVRSVHRDLKGMVPIQTVGEGSQSINSLEKNEQGQRHMVAIEKCEHLHLKSCFPHLQHSQKTLC